MNRLSAAALFALFFAVPSFAAHQEALSPRAGVAYRHFVMTPRHALSLEEQRDLARRGVFIQHAVAGGRYLVAVDPAARVSGDARITSLEALTPEKRLQRSALRAAASGKPFADLTVIFQKEVPYAEARATVESAGGAVDDPLRFDFALPGMLNVRVPSSSVMVLGRDERVMLVYAARRLEVGNNITGNADSAALSSVTPLYDAPYDLSGKGVALSLFEIGPPDNNHPEFGGRLTLEYSNSASFDDHATHVAGTMIASGILAQAKGMAPAATLHAYKTEDEPKMYANKRALGNVGSVADNNSWGYQLAWVPKSTGTWVWYGCPDCYGAYDVTYTAPYDSIARSTPVLFLHAAGNDATSTGPDTPPYAHSHRINGSDVSGYCVSPSGSGNDCPAPTCKSGMDNDSPAQPFCETTRHPQITAELPAPWMSVGLSASAKDVLAVGSIGIDRDIAPYSSRGPARDGRVKPDIVAHGGNAAIGDTVRSTAPSAQYASKQGTSMATPVVTGSAAIIVEQWRKTFAGQNPSPAILRTLMLGTTDDLGNKGPDYTYGFGLLDVKAAVDTIIADGGAARRIRTGQVANSTVEFPLAVTTAQPLRVTLGWLDPEVVTFGPDDFAAATLVNDLDLKVIDSAGQTYLPYVLDKNHPEAPATTGVNTVDNTEQVEIPNAAPGTYRLVVTGRSVTVPPQDFVLITNADMSTPCVDIFEPNNTPETAFGNIVSNQTMPGRTCDQADVDYFKFLVTATGTVSVTVTATDTPLRVTLSSSATGDVAADIPAETSRTVSTTYATGISPTPPLTFYVRVQPTGAIGSQASYTLTPLFPQGPARRTRTVRRP